MAIGVYNFNYNIRQNPLLTFTSKDKHKGKEKINLDKTQKLALNMLGLRHLGTMEHSYRTGLYAEALAEAVYSNSDRVSKIKTAAMLHDVGKIFGRDGMFAASSDPDYENDYKAHPRLGKALWRDIDEEIAEMIGAHHQKKGTIPQKVQIIKIADIFDSMTKKKYYNSSERKSPSDALQKLKTIKQLDSGLVQKFAKIIEKDNYALFNQIQKQVSNKSTEFRLQFGLPNYPTLALTPQLLSYQG